MEFARRIVDLLAPIAKSKILAFPISTVYRAWVSSDTVIPPATAMDIDPKVGGHYRLIINTPDFKSRCEGVFSVVEPENRIVYSWQWEGDDNATQIEVQFTEIPAGTKVVLTHSGFSDEQSRSNHAHGWDSFFTGFESYLDDQ